MTNRTDGEITPGNQLPWDVLLAQLRHHVDSLADFIQAFGRVDELDTTPAERERLAIALSHLRGALDAFE